MPRSREVRLGIVLYGGVSLAVYEYGVAQELYRAIRGDGIYSLLKDLIDSDIVVDIVSGTSAGGVNGIMLGFALANGKDFTSVADLWRDQADIEQLMRTEHDPATDSILNSDYYQLKLKDCFATMPPAGAALAPSVIDELDLFVTGTDVDGAVTTVYDDQGHAVDVKDHRARFKLSFRDGRAGADGKNDFAAAQADDFGTLARLTSCFPVAFEPVRIETTDRNFFRWGKLRNPAVYLDGGLLNNKPFTSTIYNISRRTANRQVDRFLIYVEPNPEVFGTAALTVAPPPPNVAEAAAYALLTIPGYQSIAADLQAIEAHNERAERLTTLFNAIGVAGPAAPERMDDAVVWATPQSASDESYNWCRLIQLRDAAVEGILNTTGGRGAIVPDDRRSGRILVESFGYWDGSAQATFQSFDVYFRLRRGSHLSRSLMRHVKAGGDAQEAAAAWEQVNHFFKLYEMLEWAMKSAVDAADFEWRKLGPEHPDLDMAPPHVREPILREISAQKWGAVSEVLSTVLSASGIRTPVQPDKDARSKFHMALSDRLKSAAAPAPGRNLLEVVDEALRRSIQALPDSSAAKLLRAEFCRFFEIDRTLFPVLFGSGFESLDAIRVVRFSPKDAQRGLCGGEVSKKVCGSALGAFGGFFKKGWRANDIMIGRMDALCQLTECLLTRVRLAQVQPGAVPLARIAQCFPNLDAAMAGNLLTRLNDYLARAAPSEADWDGLVDAMVSAAHNEILVEEWPVLLKCTLEQEYQWGQYRRNEKSPATPYDRQNLAWVRGGSRPDRVLVSVAEKAIDAGIAPAFVKGQIAGYPFLEEIPEPVIAELGLLALIRVSKSLLASVPDANRRNAVAKSGIYRGVSSQLLPVLYHWTHMRRISPDWVVVLNTIVPTVCLTALAIAVGVLFAIGPGNWLLAWRTFAALIVVPSVVLAVWGWFFRK